MNWRWHLVLFVSIFGVEATRALVRHGDSKPVVGDVAEVHNIAWNLAHGRGYRFDWDNTAWKKLWQTDNSDGRYDFVLARQGSYPTMFRPPLMPILVAGILRVFPHDSFAAWRVLDAAGFALACCLLSDVAYALGGRASIAVMLTFIVADPLRQMFVPGWWTEGIAFDLIAAIIWVLARATAWRPIIYQATGGLIVGLLCLDRSIFILLLPFIALLLAWAAVGSMRRRLAAAAVILVVSVLIQAPWWIRNIEVSGRWMPLGTQGGFNLPDEYSDTALQRHGEWTGEGICKAWIPDESATVQVPRGFSEANFLKLWPGPRRDDAMLYSAICKSLESEIAVADAGTHAAREWIRANPQKMPTLMCGKLWSLTRSVQTPLLIALLISTFPLLGSARQRRLIISLGVLTGLYVFAIALTHVVQLRFLVPILPMIYVGVSLGLASAYQGFADWQSRNAFSRMSHCSG